MCVVECPVLAIDIGLNRRAKLFKEIEETMAGKGEHTPKIVGFFDLYGNFSAKDMEQVRHDYPDILPLTVFGLRRLDTVDVFKAFGLGATGVFLARCPAEVDPFPETVERIDRFVNYARNLLESLGKNPEQLALYNMPSQGLIDKEWFEEWMGQIAQG